MNLSANKNTAAPPASTKRRGRWVIGVLITLIALFLGVLGFLGYLSGIGVNGFMPPEMATAYYTPKDVIGDLGGMPVKISRHIPVMVEYDGDPGWGEKRKGPPPERTHASRLASFGAEVRYPDMATLSTPELWKEFENKRLYNHKWLALVLESGSRYPGHGFLDRRFVGMMERPYRDYALYKSLPSPIKGLELFVASGINQRTGQPWRYEYPGGDIYIHRNREGKVMTFISCTFRSGLQRYATCTQDWSMENHALGIKLTANYIPDLLPYWQDIQERVSRFVLDFKDSKAIPVLTPMH